MEELSWFSLVDKLSITAIFSGSGVGEQLRALERLKNVPTLERRHRSAVGTRRGEGAWERGELLSLAVT
jgi:hypothetical protein